MCDLCQKNAIFEPFHCLVTFQRSSEVTDPRRPLCLPKVTKFVFVRFIEVLRSDMGFC